VQACDGTQCACVANIQIVPAVRHVAVQCNLEYQDSLPMGGTFAKVLSLVRAFSSEIVEVSDVLLVQQQKMLKAAVDLHTGFDLLGRPSAAETPSVASPGALPSANSAMPLSSSCSSMPSPASSEASSFVPFCTHCQEVGHSQPECLRRPYCTLCREYGHTLPQCMPATFCTYCKKHGHTLAQCCTLCKRKVATETLRLEATFCSYCRKHGHTLSQCKRSVNDRKYLQPPQPPQKRGRY